MAEINITPFTDVLLVKAIAYHDEHRQQGYRRHVSLVADKDASFYTIIKILNAARQAGDDDVGFVMR